MGTTIEDATGAARPLTIGGKKWWFTPLDAKQWGEYFAWLRDEYLELMKRNARDLEPEDRARILDRAFATAPTLDLDSAELKGTMNTPEGIYRLVKMHLMPRHPDVTDEQIAGMLNSQDLRKAAMSKVASTIPSESNGSPRPEKKTKRRRKARRRRR